MRIYKYPLHVIDEQDVILPYGARILTVQAQGQVPTLWAQVDENEERKEPIRICIYGTGSPMPNFTGPYIGSFQLLNGSFVGHVFHSATRPGVE